ncbi:MAG: alpha/beta hydrolase-fold protein [Luteibaculaceae bacterium]
MRKRYYFSFFSRLNQTKVLMLAVGFWLLTLVQLLGQQQAVFKITSLPSNTPLQDSIFMVGTFNNWNPQQAEFGLPASSNSLLFTLTGTGTINYKFTRGGWNRVEGNAQGQFLPNRNFTFGSADTVFISIASWEDLGATVGSTANENVSILSASFFMPQLNRNRRIWIYKPSDYNSNPEKYYPVIYMHDAQNLFDALTSFAGEWEVDEALTALEQAGNYGIIVVGIDNGGVHRINELTPFTHPSFGGGDGNLYLDFITETLKPYIDNNFRTLPGRDYTAIGGSSLGGLISYYGLFHAPETFSKALVFSPSFWFNLNALNLFNGTINWNYDYRIAMVGGLNEGSNMALHMTNVSNFLLNEGLPEDELLLQIDADGAHSEWYWRREFPDAYQWLFQNFELPTAVNEISIRGKRVSLYPNPTYNHFFLENTSSTPIKSIHIKDSMGRLLFAQNHATIPLFLSVEPYVSGTYFVQIRYADGFVETQRIVKY